MQHAQLATAIQSNPQTDAILIPGVHQGPGYAVWNTGKQDSESTILRLVLDAEGNATLTQFTGWLLDWKVEFQASTPVQIVVASITAAL